MCAYCVLYDIQLNSFPDVGGGLLYERHFHHLSRCQNWQLFLVLFYSKMLFLSICQCKSIHENEFYYMQKLLYSKDLLLS